MLWTKIDSRLQNIFWILRQHSQQSFCHRAIVVGDFKYFGETLGNPKFIGPMALWPMVGWVPTTLWPWIGDAWLFVCHDLFRGTGNVIFFFSMYFLFGDLSSLGTPPTKYTTIRGCQIYITGPQAFPKGPQFWEFDVPTRSIRHTGLISQHSWHFKFKNLRPLWNT